MKKNHFTLFTACCIAVFSNTLFAQNTIPEEGNVGIGTSNPQTALDVAGSVKIDSTLTVLDSIVVSKSAHIMEAMTIDGQTMMREDATAERNLQVEGDAYFNGNAYFSNGDVFFNYMADNASAGNDVLGLDAAGRVRRVDILGLVYSQPAPSQFVCSKDQNGNVIPLSPRWVGSPNKLYTGGNCVTDPMVGIGTVPTANSMSEQKSIHLPTPC